MRCSPFGEGYGARTQTMQGGHVVQHEATTMTQEQLLHEEARLAHEHGELLAERDGSGDAMEEAVFLPYAYALESVVT